MEPAALGWVFGSQFHLCDFVMSDSQYRSPERVGHLSPEHGHPSATADGTDMIAKSGNHEISNTTLRAKNARLASHAKFEIGDPEAEGNFL